MEQKGMALLEALLRLKTTNEPDNRAEHDRCRDLIAKEAESRGLRHQIVKSDPYPSIMVGANPGDKNPKVLLAAHLDVVPANTPDQYEPKVVGGRLMARGASDMKFCVPLYFRVLDEVPKALRDRILMAFTFDEEIGGKAGTRYLLEEYGLRAGTCFLPDGGDNFQLEADEKGVLQFRIRTTGKSAHGSRPWLGDNAIDRFLAIYADLRHQFPAIDKPGVWGPTLNLGKITGGAAANQGPDSREAMLDTRLTENSTLSDTKSLVEKIVAGRGEVEAVVAGDVYHLDPKSPSFIWIQQAAKAHLGKELPIYKSEGASDARFFTQYGIPVVLAKPTCAGHHSADEWIDLESIGTYYKILREFVEKAAA
ncbi:MAG: M20 family metallopeptidase [Candidatus Riflebacteria bacterium]|nr:M20 family metallopeptidase [Candidatus Riflebacteria bacterium]